MREIKFRGKDNYGDWRYGSLIQYKSGDVAIANFERYGNECSTMSRTNVDPATVGQFTGMKDRKGNEVYEGDILMVEGIKYPRYHIVSWDERKFMFCIDETPLYAYLHGDTLLREYVVCGSVFDHPDLIEKGGEE